MLNKSLIRGKYFIKSSKNSSLSLNVVVNPITATNQNMNFVSSNEDVATVSSTGVITTYEVDHDTILLITVTPVDNPSAFANIKVTVKNVVEADNDTPTNKTEEKKGLFGCSGSLVVSTAIISILALVGASLLIYKKKEN